MCPCFPAKEEYKHILDEKTEEEVAPEVVPQDGTNDMGVVIRDPGTVIIPGPQTPQEEPITRPNPIDFIWKLIKLLIKISIKAYERYRTSRNGGLK